MTIARDRPVLVLEVTVHHAPARTRALLARVDSLGYDAFMIEEICGMRPDCRNLLALPRPHRTEKRSRFSGSDALDLASASRALIPVDAHNIGSLAFPCCRRGGACCPYRDPDRRGRIGKCCTHWQVHTWLNGPLRNGSADPRAMVHMQWYTRVRWYEQRYHGWSEGSISLPMVREELDRNLSDAGLTRPPNFAELFGDRGKYRYRGASRWGGRREQSKKSE